MDMNPQDPLLYVSVPDPSLESSFWKTTNIGIGRRVAKKAHAAMRRARRCATNNDRRRLSAHLRTYNRLLQVVFTGRDTKTVLLTRNDVCISRHQAIFGSSGTGCG
jgi:uncharacterized protein with von Willebrand factor type A (vWA) domain